MPHHYKKKQTGPISKEKKGGVKPKQQTKMGPGRQKALPTKTRTRTGFNPKAGVFKQPAVKTDRIEDRPGFFPPGMKMQIGSKQKNTPSNFSGSAFKMITGEDPGSGQYDMYGDYYKDPMNSLGQDQMENMQENFGKAMSGYEPPVQLVSKNTGGDSAAYQTLGAGLRKLITPKPDSQAEANQKYRQDKRKAKRKKQGGTNVGNKLRKVFKTGNQNKNL